MHRRCGDFLLYLTNPTYHTKNVSRYDKHADVSNVTSPQLREKAYIKNAERCSHLLLVPQHGVVEVPQVNSFHYMIIHDLIPSVGKQFLHVWSLQDIV